MVHFYVFIRLHPRHLQLTGLTSKHEIQGSRAALGCLLRLEGSQRRPVVQTGMGHPEMGPGIPCSTEDGHSAEAFLGNFFVGTDNWENTLRLAGGFRTYFSQEVMPVSIFRYQCYQLSPMTTKKSWTARKRPVAVWPRNLWRRTCRSCRVTSEPWSTGAIRFELEGPQNLLEP